jgi:prevent-host-death family protein
MAKTIGVRELKNQTSRIVRAIREGGTEYVITVHGEPVAVLRAYTQEDAQRLQRCEVDQALAEIEVLAQEVAAAWTSPQSGVELVDEQRR